MGNDIDQPQFLQKCPKTISDRILSGIFSYFTRAQLERLSSTNRKIRRIVSENHPEAPFRLLADVNIDFFGKTFSLEHWIEARAEFSIIIRDFDRYLPLLESKTLNNLGSTSIVFDPSQGIQLDQCLNYFRYLDRILESSHLWANSPLKICVRPFRASNSELAVMYSTFMHAVFRDPRIVSTKAQDISVEVLHRPGKGVFFTFPKRTSLYDCKSVTLKLAQSGYYDEDDEDIGQEPTVDFIADYIRGMSFKAQEEQTLDLQMPSSNAIELVKRLRKDFDSARDTSERLSYTVSLELTYYANFEFSAVNLFTDEELVLVHQHEPKRKPRYVLKRSLLPEEYEENSLDRTHG
ncbi:hypothetical protein DdX_14181 [Ditylenchus destructor]|uniref:F-box domain-containing protein n=1 Tax=Ditylenchus destructor TaxID=166010 RepID=A0AAD4MSL8_9BILA|nr:hypothetical protein DdX_14181 [Ditylenchus destructor]